MSQNENKPINLGPGIKHNYTQKPYYGTMYFKVVYDVRDPKEHRKQMAVWSMTPTTRRELFSKSKVLASAITRFCNKELKANTRHRAEGSKVTFFLEKEEHTRALIKQFDKNIVEVYVPYNNVQIQIGNSDMMATPLFRARLFEESSYCQGFRYKVQVKASTEMKSIKGNLQSFFNNINRKDYSYSSNVSMLLASPDKLRPWQTLSMYFNDEQDLLMLKLMIGGTEMEVYKVILHRELVLSDK